MLAGFTESVASTGTSLTLTFNSDYIRVTFGTFDCNSLRCRMSNYLGLFLWLIINGNNINYYYMSVTPQTEQDLTAVLTP